MTNPDLAALSEAATQGPWKKGAKRNCDIDIIGKPTWPCTRYGKKGEWDVAVVTELENVKEQQANAAFIVSLVNEYRAGRLVHIDEGTRERVARAMCAATGKDPDKLNPAPRGAIGMVPLWTLWATQADATIAAQKAEIERLTERLERKPPFDSDELDGISCRDETIKLLDERIERLTERAAQAKLDGVRAGIEAAKEAIGLCVYDDSPYDMINDIDAEAIAKGEG